MVQDASFRHMSLRALALHAQRMGRVFAAVSTWARLVRERGWLRPRRRLFPAKKREGIRASRPNQYWHLDVTVIKLLDGTRTYLHAVIDNFSRRLLAWKPPSMWSNPTRRFPMRPMLARRQMRCISVVGTTFPESLPTVSRLCGTGELPHVRVL
jgi:hypothetical protein